jgi:hypothetical protein
MPDYMEGDERAAQGHPVPANMTYAEWLKTQSDEFVREALGPSRFKMWKEGTPVTAFAENKKIFTLEELKNKGI